MIWAQWSIVGVALAGVLAFGLLALRLWREVKAFGTMLGTATATLADATASLEAAQQHGPVRLDRDARRPAYTDRLPT